MAQEKELTRVQELIYEMNVAQVMVTNVITVRPNDRMSTLQDLLRNKRISGVPVIEENQLVGLVSIEDFVKCLVDGKMGSPVKERMSQQVKTLYDSDALIHAVKEFDRLGYGRFPVVNCQTGKLVGIITKGDIVKGLLRKMEIDYQKKENDHSRANHFLQDIISDNTTITFQHNIIGKDFDRAGETSSDLKKKLKRMGVPPEIVRRIAIASFETEMNMVVFTNGGELTTRITSGEIAVEAVDSGPGITDVERAMEPGYSTAPDWVRELGFGAGMGLSNIKKCTDEMHIESTEGEGTRLAFTVCLNR